MAASVLVHHWRRSAAFVQISGVVFIQPDLDERVWVSRSCELGWPRCTQGRVLSLLLAINYFPWLMVISEAQQYFFSLEFLVQVSPFFYAPLDSLSVPLLFNEINMTAVLKLCEQSNSQNPQHVNSLSLLLLLLLFFAVNRLTCSCRRVTVWNLISWLHMIWH